MFRHSSTYRIQFNPHFTFSALKGRIDYLSLLGTNAVYASPVFQSTPGSMHGYDVTNPSTIDPGLGGVSDFKVVIEKLKKRKISWIQDIVPNHMAFNRHNTRLWDVLEKGEDSVFAGIFDIDWNHPEFEGKLMVPFLGKSLEQVLLDNELQLVFESGSFSFKYFDEYYPVNFQGYRMILKIWLDQLPSDSHEIREILTGVEKSLNSSEWMISRDQIRKDLNNHYRESAEVREWIDRNLSKMNSDPTLLNSVLDIQNYRLAFWKQTEKQINYRRFFTVNGLICLRMEDPQVFKNYHSFLNELVKQKTIAGLRIDHIDGLQDPEDYLHRLRKMVGQKIYIVVEKILELNEELPGRWNVEGTTGYDFLACVNNLLTNQVHYQELSGFYKKISGIDQDIEDIIYEKKKFVLLHRMSGELDNLLRIFWTSGLVPEASLGRTSPVRMKEAIAEFLIVFPVYRLYCNSIPPDEKNIFMINQVIRNAISRNPGLNKELKILMNLFRGHFDIEDQENKRSLHFFNRCMQFTGPLMAKGVEDTTMYYFNQFIVHNEVGDFPGSQGLSQADFHAIMQHRLKWSPVSMNSTSTHDTKRGEDVRARLNVLSDLAPDWISHVISWMKINAVYKREINGIMVPTANEEYLIYQTLAGIWPMDQVSDHDLMDRLKEYFIKAMREAKTHSAWNDPVQDHELAVIDFLFRILNPGSSFLQSFIKFEERILGYGYLNSLVQLVLKMTCPGIPDIYQGTEMWDLTLVDPDNRQPVDYDLRYDCLKNLVMRGRKDPGRLWKEVWMHPASGEVKLWLTHLLLGERKQNPELFLKGEYIPLEIEGKLKEHAIAYTRQIDGNQIIVVLPLHLADIQERMVPGRENINWEDTSVKLMNGLSGNYLDIISGTEFSLGSSLWPRDFHCSDPLIILRSI